MSVIIAKPTARRSTLPPGIGLNYFPSLSVSATVPASGTSTIDTLPLADYQGAKWLLIVTGASDTRMQAFEMLALQGSTVTPVSTHYAIIGDVGLDIDATVTITGANLNLIFTNNDLIPLTVYAARLGIPTTNSLTFPSSYTEVANISTTVAVAQTQAIDFIPLSKNICGGQWLITITTSTGERLSTKLLALFSSGPVATEYNLVGDQSITYNIVVTEVSGLGFEVALENTGGLDYIVDITRISIATVPMTTPPMTGTVEAVIAIPASVTIPSGTTRTVDLLSHAYIAGATWLVTIVHSPSRAMGCEVSTVNPATGSTATSIYAILGDDVDVDIITAIIANRSALNITNNESTPITVNTLRVPIAA